MSKHSAQKSELDSRGIIFLLRSSVKYRGDVPKTLTLARVRKGRPKRAECTHPTSSANFNNMSGRGWNGEPSYSNMDAPVARLAKFNTHITQAVYGDQKSASQGSR